MLVLVRVLCHARRVGVSRYGESGIGVHGANLRALLHAASIFVGCWPMTTEYSVSMAEAELTVLTE
jgi:hypothetical protein